MGLTKAARCNRLYVTQRVLLMQMMGGRCHFCGRGGLWTLEFHHTKRRKWDLRKFSQHRRIRKYMQDWLNDELVLACGSIKNGQRGCNQKNGKPPPEDEVPF